MSDGKIIDDEDIGLEPPEGFTGTFEYYWPNQTLKFRGGFLNGEPHGTQECWWDNGRIAQIGQTNEGVCVGLWNDYNEKGRHIKSTIYKDSDNFSVLWYGDSGLISEIENYIDRVLVQHIVC